MRVTPQSIAATHTVDCVLFGYTKAGLMVLLVKRSVEPFAGSWVLPGGAIGENDTLESTASNVLREMIGVTEGRLRQIATYSDPHRHPIRRVITTSFYGLVHPEDHQPVPGLHLSEARWFPVRTAPALGFDHSRLLQDAYRTLAEELDHSPVAFKLLPDRFILTEVQQLYEDILGEELDRANFRRKLLTYDFLIRTDEKKPGVRGGPSLYRYDARLLESVL